MIQHSKIPQCVTYDGLVNTGANSSTSDCSDGIIGHMGILLLSMPPYIVVGRIPLFVSPPLSSFVAGYWVSKICECSGIAAQRIEGVGVLLAFQGDQPTGHLGRKISACRSPRPLRPRHVNGRAERRSAQARYPTS